MTKITLLWKQMFTFIAVNDKRKKNVVDPTSQTRKHEQQHTINTYINMYQIIQKSKRTQEDQKGFKKKNISSC